MDAVIVIGASEKEIASLVLTVQGRQKISRERKSKESERKRLICVYERRLKKSYSQLGPGATIRLGET